MTGCGEAFVDCRFGAPDAASYLAEAEAELAHHDGALELGVGEAAGAVALAAWAEFHAGVEEGLAHGAVAVVQVLGDLPERPAGVVQARHVLDVHLLIRPACARDLGGSEAARRRSQSIAGAGGGTRTPLSM